LLSIKSGITYWVLLLLPTLVLGIGSLWLVHREADRMEDNLRAFREARLASLDQEAETNAANLLLALEEIREALLDTLADAPSSRLEQALDTLLEDNPFIRASGLWRAPDGFVAGTLQGQVDELPWDDRPPVVEWPVPEEHLTRQQVIARGQIRTRRQLDSIARSQSSTDASSAGVLTAGSGFSSPAATAAPCRSPFATGARSGCQCRRRARTGRERLDREGRVLGVDLRVPPNRVRGRRDAYAVLEVPADHAFGMISAMAETHRNRFLEALDPRVPIYRDTYNEYFVFVLSAGGAIAGTQVPLYIVMAITGLWDVVPFVLACVVFELAVIFGVARPQMKPQERVGWAALWAAATAVLAFAFWHLVASPTL
jgi:hypothetical protein